MRLEDAQQRWVGTIVLINNVPCMVDGLGGPANSETFEFVYYAAEGGVWVPYKRVVGVKEVSEYVPQLGVIQVGGCARYLTTRATHQFRRGLVLRNIQQTAVGHPDFTSDFLNTTPINSAEVVSSAYFPEYTSMMQAYRDVMRGDVLSRCFTRTLSLGAGESRWPVLYYNQYPVGRVTHDVIELAEAVAPLREEISEASRFPVVIK